ncbi:scopoletin glucosyltransferase-like [Gossypium australe]|uniref:Scopoletin glucosyltransferase-like n=1 Tax=Gossypium australe TaxID=47621 RepID=A0A5B6X6N9_9ROSI|nr:scopoletin glucosyltransferase-like [Gossypium australe]
MRREIHMFFLPFLAHGHLIPVVDMAKIEDNYSYHSSHALLFSNTIERSKESGIHIGVELLNFPTVDVGLPEGCENVDLTPTSQDGNLEMITKFFQAALMLQQPFQKLLQERKPDCLVADTFFHWATDAAHKFGIPGLLLFIMYIGVHESIQAIQEGSVRFPPFVVPNLPGDIKLTRNQMPDYVKQDAETNSTKLLKAI